MPEFRKDGIGILYEGVLATMPYVGNISCHALASVVGRIGRASIGEVVCELSLCDSDQEI